jgi:hypothetical protein
MAINLQISRRTVLRGLGTAMALPLLEAMMPRPARAAAPTARPPVRMAFVYVPNGVHMPDWMPSTEGTNFEVRSVLEPLAAYKSHMTVFGGLTLNGARALGDGGGDHARSVAAFLTGAHPYKTGGSDIRNGVSVDQVAAEKIGHHTRFPSLELGCEPSAQSGTCDTGYSCAYSSNMSWRTPTNFVPKEIHPQAVFDRLFGSGNATEADKNRAKRNQDRKSILDFVLEDANSLRRQLGNSDQRKIDEYLHAVRQVERQITDSEKLPLREEDVPDYPRPAGTPREIAEHARLMFDLMLLAFQTDQTRVISFMYTNDSSNRNYPSLEIREGHHDLSHHGRNAEKQAKISKINRYHMEQFAYFIAKLAAVKEGNGSLLDQSMIVYGSGIADGDRHAHDNLPILLMGRGGGSVRPGRFIKYPNETPLTNLYLAMLERVGAPTPKLADSTGPLKGLEG